MNLRDRVLASRVQTKWESLLQHKGRKKINHIAINRIVVNYIAINHIDNNHTVVNHIAIDHIAINLIAIIKSEVVLDCCWLLNSGLKSVPISGPWTTTVDGY